MNINMNINHQKTPLIFTLFNPDNSLIQSIILQNGYELGELTFHTFPDGETSVIIQSDVKDRTVIFLTQLDRPNDKFLPLLFAAETAKMLGAGQVGLITTYLPYMREDKQFHPGEGITAKYFSKVLSEHFSWLITVDPHLHRFPSLDKIYTIPTQVLHAADPIAHWIKENIENPVLIGPDNESTQWVSDIAQKANAPYIILEKTRKGDRSIEVSLPTMTMEVYKNATPILVDDIISTGRTLIEPIKQLKNSSLKAPICIGVHAVFADNAYQDLLDAGAEKVITCNSIGHLSNQINLANIIAPALKSFLLGDN